jgi:ketosteroid isomerase-like protein
MAVSDIIRHFYDGLAQKNDTWQDHLADDVVFADASNRLHAEGRDAFIQSFTPFLHAVANVQVKQLIVEGANACAVVSYEYVSPKGATLHQDDAEVWKVVDEKIAALTIYFDITEFQNFMRG